jgi:hypothetical protein
VRRLLCSIFVLLTLLFLPDEATAATSGRTESERLVVAVIFALKSQREHRVSWQSGLTVDAAIQAAAGKRRAAWTEAWRYRESFWTRNFRNPHSFWARVFAGERASGFAYFTKATEPSKTAALKPGDRIYVDLAPIQ